MLEGGLDHLDEAGVMSEPGDEPLCHRGAEFDGSDRRTTIKEVASRLARSRSDLAHLTTGGQHREQIVEQGRRIAVASPLVAVHGLIEPAAIVEIAPLRHHPPV